MNKTIKDISIEIGSGITPLRSNELYWNAPDIPWIKTEQLGQYRIFDSTEYISNFALEDTNIRLWPPHTVSVAMYGEGKTRGNASILMIETTTNQACCNIKVNDALADYRFLYYWLKNNYDNLRTLSAGVRKNLNADDIKNFPFPQKSLPEQEKIADILSVVDDKIELNSKICSELEAMAKTIYDYWFVQFDFPDKNGKPYRTSGGEMVWNEQLKREIPKGWEVKNIQKVCAIVDCLHSKKPDLSFDSENYYLLQLDNLVDMGLLNLSNKYYVSSNDYASWTSKIEVRCGDLVITNAGRVGDIARIPEGIICGIGRNITAIRAVNIDPIFMYYFFASSDMKAQIKSNTDTGSFFGSLNVRGIKQLIMAIPPEESEIMNLFIDIVRPIRDNLEMIALQSQELSKLRDWLLPMLMNGQARVE